jgi:hypothetical protein
MAKFLQVRTNFGVEKDTLLRQYRFGVEQALARARFLNTNEIVTVQAFVLFLVCVRRHDDTRFVWSLTGLALRIAQSLGLHRDGTKFGLSPFDTEMRRRLWWVRNRFSFLFLMLSLFLDRTIRYTILPSTNAKWIFLYTIWYLLVKIPNEFIASLYSRYPCVGGSWFRPFDHRFLF